MYAWMMSWALNPSTSQFFLKSSVEGSEEYDILGGGTWTTQKEQLADEGYCNHLQPPRYGALTENIWFDFGDVRS